jgi:hypothetical protein
MRKVVNIFAPRVLRAATFWRAHASRVLTTPKAFASRGLPLSARNQNQMSKFTEATRALPIIRAAYGLGGGVGRGLGVARGLAVGVGLPEAVAVAVAVGLAVAVAVGVDVAVAVAVAVGVTVAVGLAVGVGVGVPAGSLNA